MVCDSNLTVKVVSIQYPGTGYNHPIITELEEIGTARLVVFFDADNYYMNNAVYDVDPSDYDSQMWSEDVLEPEEMGGTMNAYAQASYFGTQKFFALKNTMPKINLVDINRSNGVIMLKSEDTGYFAIVVRNSLVGYLVTSFRFYDDTGELQGTYTSSVNAVAGMPFATYGGGFGGGVYITDASDKEGFISKAENGGNGFIIPVNGSGDNVRYQIKRATGMGSDLARWIMAVVNPISIPVLPTFDVVNLGMIRMYKADTGDLQSLSEKLWDNNIFDISNWQKLFANPMDAVVGLTVVPFVPSAGASERVYLGNLDTGVDMLPLVSQWKEIDFGEVSVAEQFGGFLDYAPFTTSEIYLPYCGNFSLDTNAIMGKDVGIKYHLDALSGSCIAYVTADGDLIGTYVGNCAYSLPVTAGEGLGNIIQGIIGIASAVAPLTAGVGKVASAAQAGARLAARGVTAAGKAAMSAAQMGAEKISMQVPSPSAGGVLSPQTPYITLSRPREARPANQEEYTGLTYFTTASLGSLSGFTVVSGVRLTGFSPTTAEKEEIERLLSEGVIL